ncbi:MAG: tetratricopeptide repeat protein, partial [Bacteroidota bacterium]
MKNVALYFLFIFIWLSSCSSERNTLTSKAFHNTTAHYNGYFYALEEIRKIELTHQKNMVDDYNRILRLYPTFDSSLAKGYDKEIQEAVKMASIAIQRHPNSKWVDDSYILVGKARLYSLDWGNAIQTFKHVNTKSKDLDTKHLAIINLIRTYTEHKEYNNAQAAIDYLQKQVDAMSKSNRKKLYLEKAYFYQEQMDYDNMVRNLTAAEPMLKKRDKRGRIYFIIGQVYQKLGFEAEAYNYYEKCLSTNPEYEVDFYARLYMAQVTEISRSKDVNTARKSFKKLLKDNKNREFQDKIYYEMGVFEFKQKNLREAIDNFNLSVRIGTNKRIDGEAYLRMGEIYYESLKDYEKSQAYYDSAISALPTDYDGYAKIKARQEILNEFVKHIKTIQWQDSLLALASLDSVQLRTLIYQELAERKKEEEKNKRKQKKQRNRVEISSNTNSNIFNTEEKEGSAEGADWYFGNSSALALGQNEFQRVWGNIVLEDNWRRSQKLAAAANLGNGNNNSADSTSSTAVTAATQPNVDPADAEYGRLSKEIPKTEKDKQEALHKIEEAYFNLGDIYYFKLLETENAKSTYLKLLGRFPETEHEPEVLYKLYLITKDSIPAESEQYAARLKTKYPGSTFTKILLNPNYLQASSQAAEKQKSLYKAAYELYQSGRYDSATHIITTALAID